MGEELNETKRQVLKAVRQVGIPCDDGDIVQATGLDPAIVREALCELGATHLHTKPRQSEGILTRVEVLGFDGD